MVPTETDIPRLAVRFVLLALFDFVYEEDLANLARARAVRKLRHY